MSKDKEKKVQRMNGQTHFVELKAVPTFPVGPSPRASFTNADRWAMVERWFEEDPSMQVEPARLRLISETGKAVDNKRMAVVRNRIRFRKNLRPIGREYGCGTSTAAIAEIPMTQEERDDFARDFPELTKDVPRITKTQRARMSEREAAAAEVAKPAPTPTPTPTPTAGPSALKPKAELERDIQAVADMAAEIPGLRRLEIAFDDDGRPVVRYAATMLAESTL